jgi:hypothetical protein
VTPAALPLVRVRGRWAIAVGRARVDVAGGELGRREALEVARRTIAAGLVRGVSPLPRPLASCGPCTCGDCLACEVREMRAKRAKK